MEFLTFKVMLRNPFLRGWSGNVSLMPSIPYNPEIGRHSGNDTDKNKNIANIHFLYPPREVSMDTPIFLGAKIHQVLYA
jgi:hypothetical protein